jgi:hypothetical protein
VRKRTGNAGLWKQVDLVLQRRPGWNFHATSSPGAPSVWCFGSERDPELIVEIGDQLIRIEDRGSNATVEVENADALGAWLHTHRPSALQPQKGGVSQRLKRGRFIEW